MSIKFIVSGIGVAALIAFGAGLAHKFYAADLAKYKALTKQLSIDLNKQNSGIRAWLKEGEKLKAQIAAAEAKQPEIVTRTEWRVKTITESAPALTAPCVEVMAWQRERFKEFCLRWQQVPP